jgi:hypothetical protein
MPANACEELARVADAISTENQSWPAHEFLVELAARVSGVRRGPLAAVGLLLGGRARLKGGGFRAELRDHSAGQTRHFVGIARAVTVLGASRTRWISVHVRRDSPDSPDGRLTDLAIEFATSLLRGSLTTAQAGDWIRTHVCGN